MADLHTPAALGWRTSTPALRLWTGALLMGLSGFAGLGSQMVWVQRSTLWLGHESVAVLAVLAAFFGGLALGSLALGGRIERSARPQRWYVACEAVIAIWAFALALGMGPASQTLLQAIGPTPAGWKQGLVAFLGTFLLLLPATAAMGATLPAMERLLQRWQETGAPIGTLYAANTLGAALGVVVAAFWWVPTWGLTKTGIGCACLSLLVAVWAWWAFVPAGAATGRPQAALALAAKVGPGSATLFFTGWLGIAYEVLAVRVLSQVTDNTVYTYALLLVVYLLGTALGAAAYQRWLAPHGDQAALRHGLIATTALTCLAGGAGLYVAAPLHGAVQLGWAETWGAGIAAALGAETALALAAFVLPTLAMGALFSHLCTAARAAGEGLARPLGLNTLGAALAPAAVGWWALPTLGAKGTLFLIVAGYLALWLPALRIAQPWHITAGLGAALGLGALALLAPALRTVDLPPNGRLVQFQEGRSAAVSVVEDAAGVLTLHINNRQQEGSSATRLADARQAVLPLLLHPAPRQALFLGLGTGLTARSAAEDRLLAVDAVELLPEVITAARQFDVAFEGAAVPAGLNIIAADARRFVRATDKAYDVIVADNFHPARSGSGTLYTKEHFEAVRQRLAPQGLFCQWLPLHQLDLPTLKTIVRTYLAVFPAAHVVLATHSLDTPVLGLVASVAPLASLGLAPTQVNERIASATRQPSAANLGLGDAWAVLGSFVAGPASLHAWSADAPLNTDDHPVVAYRAPQFSYAEDSLARDRLLSLLAQWKASPQDLLSADAATDKDQTLQTRLSAYWAARNAYLKAGRDVRPSRSVTQMLAQVREPLLQVLRTSPDFAPAYDPLLTMAQALAQQNVAAARELLQTLVQVAPARPEAARALAALPR